jgi:tetratricopeptide (TPR) repeat protein
VAAVLAAPGALRHSVARVAGEALRRASEVRPLVVLVDDAQWADQTTLDALELAVMAGKPAAIWIGVATQPSLLALRQMWGEHAGQHARHEVVALDAIASAEMARDLLQPVEFVPESVLAQMFEMTGGVPLAMVELVDTLRLSGAIRKHQTGTGWYLAADELAQLSTGGLADKLAERTLAPLPGALVAIARVCAVLGAQVTKSEVEQARQAIHAYGVELEDSDWDTGVALGRLTSAGVLSPVDAGRYRFRRPLVQQAIEQGMPSLMRRQLHEAVFRWLELADDPASVRARLARHAAAAGAREEAFVASFELAEEDRRRHRYIEADQRYTEALQFLDEKDARRRKVLAGRGTMRYRVNRLQDALADLAGARAIPGDDPSEVDLLLEESTVLDWAGEFQRSGELADSATSASRSADDTTHCKLAVARSLVRKGKLTDAIDVYVDALRNVRAYEPSIIGRLMLGSVLGLVSRHAEAESVLGNVISDCRHSCDWIHLCASLGNRATYVWRPLGQYEKAVTDFVEAIETATRTGNALVRVICMGNLAECHFYGGDWELALPVARQARDLQECYVGGFPDQALMVARISGAMNDLAEARKNIQWIRSKVLPGDLEHVRLQVEALELFVAGTGDANAWQRLLVEATTKPHAELWEIKYLRALDLLNRSEDVPPEFSTLHSEMPRNWQRRLERLCLSKPQSHAGVVSGTTQS